MQSYYVGSNCCVAEVTNCAWAFVVMLRAHAQHPPQQTSEEAKTEAHAHTATQLGDGMTEQALTWLALHYVAQPVVIYKNHGKKR